MSVKLRQNINIGNVGEYKIALKFDVTMLNMIIGYIYKDTSQINRRSLHNVKKLFDIIDERIYEGKPNLETRLNFIKRTLKAKLDKGYENEAVILNYCREEEGNINEINNIINSLDFYRKINFEEIKFITQAISDRLKYAYLLPLKDEIYKTVERLDAGDYDSYAEINEELSTLCREVINQNRKLSVLEDTMSFSIDDENFEDNVIDIVTKLKNPSGVVRTGIQKLNQILAPGYLSGRLYCYMGLPAGFKSGILLKSALDAKKYNKGLLKSSKPGKRPCILFITMENTVEESIERIFNMTVTPEDIRKYSPQEVVEMLRNVGEMKITDDDDIDIIIKYYKNRSIDTSAIYTIIEELADDNKDVRMLILDYIKRIRPAEPAKDEKAELKNVTNELKTIAIDVDIPVITAHQLNREAAATIDAAMTSDKEDLARFVGRANIGSSYLLCDLC